MPRAGLADTWEEALATALCCIALGEGCEQNAVASLVALGEQTSLLLLLRDASVTNCRIPYKAPKCATGCGYVSRNCPESDFGIHSLFPKKTHTENCPLCIENK